MWGFIYSSYADFIIIFYSRLSDVVRSVKKPYKPFIYKMAAGSPIKVSAAHLFFIEPPHGSPGGLRVTGWGAGA